ncbi:MAG: hypothetical protein ACE5J4_01960 [Candidatus Aenigmatarchaeota archaeon]
MKGQVILIISVLVVIILILIKLNTQTFTEKPQNILPTTYLNLKNELIKTIDISLLNQEDVSSNLNAFIAFSKQILERRGYNQEINYNIVREGDITKVYINLNLSLSNSYINDDFTITRTVFT